MALAVGGAVGIELEDPALCLSCIRPRLGGPALDRIQAQGLLLHLLHQGEEGGGRMSREPLRCGIATVSKAACRCG